MSYHAETNLQMRSAESLQYMGKEGQGELAFLEGKTVTVATPF